MNIVGLVLGIILEVVCSALPEGLKTNDGNRQTRIPDFTKENYIISANRSSKALNRKPRIVNGDEVEENEYPWQVALVWKGTSFVFGGGAIIGSRHILTAAHCEKRLEWFDVLVGAHDMTDPVPSQIRLTPAKWTSHENYNSVKFDNDIAIVTLKETISFSWEVSPICLPANDDNDYEDVDAIVSGWGHTKEGGSNSDVLMGVTVPTMTNMKCQEYLDDFGEISENMLCAGYKKGKRDSCLHDSGGPLITKTGSFFTLIGLVSWADGCARPERPGVYTRVTKYLDWIAENSALSIKCHSE